MKNYTIDIDITSIRNEKVSAVYKLSFDNLYFYIGGTTNLKRRIIQWRYSLSKGSSNKKIDYLALGKGNIKLEVLEYVENSNSVHDIEDKYIKQYHGQPFFLNRSNSAFTNEGMILTPTERKRLGDNARGIKHTPEQNRLKAIRQTGRVQSIESRLKLSQSRKGIKFSDEHKQKLRLAKLGKKQSVEHIEKVRLAHIITVSQYDRHGNLMATYPSMTAAGIANGLAPNTISQVCSNKRKSAKGMYFSKA